MRLMRTITTACALSAALVAWPMAQTAEADMRREHVEFAGWTGDVLEGSIQGRDIVRYELQASAGDTLTLLLHANNSATYFNVYAPGRGPGEEALANSGMTSSRVPAINEFSAVLDSTGTYTVTVYLFRAAARAGESSDYALEIDLLNPAQASDPGADTPTFQVRTRATGGHLNVHTGPNVDSARIGRFPNGAILRNIGGCEHGTDRDWCEVMAENGGLAGFVAREFLAPVSAHSGTSTTRPRPMAAHPSAPAAPARAATITPTSDFFHVHLSDPRGHLNVHAEPSSSSVRVGRLQDGSDLQNIGGCVQQGVRTWCDVMQAGGGVSGWVAAEFLRDGHEPAAHVPAAAAPVTDDFADGMSGGPDWWQVSLNRAGSSLRVHSQPSTDAPIVGRFQNGAPLRNAGGCRMVSGERWCSVTSVAGNVTGWVAGTFLSEGSAPGVASHVLAPAPQAAQAPQQAPAAEQPMIDAGPDFDMTGSISCIADRDAAEQSCTYGAVHEGSGNGFLVVTQDGFNNRMIGFEGGVPTYFDNSQADGDMAMNVTNTGDAWTVFIGDARFVIPVNVFGGNEGVAAQLPLAPPVTEAASTGLVASDYDATAQVSCIRDRDAPEAMCDAGVTRNGDGSGFVYIAWPDYGSRVIFFENNTPTHYDESEADAGAEMTVTQDGDTYTVFVGEARFVFPEAFMTGG